MGSLYEDHGEVAAGDEALNIDPAFVLPPELRPRQRQPLEGEDDDIPLIDLAPLYSEKADEKAIESMVKEMAKASEEWGFFQIINHGVPMKSFEEVKEEAEKFFSQPWEEKLKVRKTSEKPVGYFECEVVERTRDWKEVFDFAAKGKIELRAGDGKVVTVENIWPEFQPRLRVACEIWVGAIEKLGNRLLELLALGLGLPATYFNKSFGVHANNGVRLNYYRPCPAPDLALGVNKHRDEGALTILAQDDVGGLEVKRKDGEWIRVRPQRGAFIINVGNMFQVWSNDKYQSAEHRAVVNEHNARFSIPFFLSPSYSTNVSPILELLDDRQPAKYKEYNYGDFVHSRRKASLNIEGAKLPQISDYAITP